MSILFPLRLSLSTELIELISPTCCLSQVQRSCIVWASYVVLLACPQCNSSLKLYICPCPHDYVSAEAAKSTYKQIVSSFYGTVVLMAGN